MRNSGSLIFGLILIAVGSVFLLDNLGYIDSEYVFENFWPLILVAVGISMLIRRPRSLVPAGSQEQIGKVNQADPSPAPDEDFFVRSSVLGDVRARLTTKNFSGGSCSVVFGNIDIDLREADFTPGVPILKLNGVLGSIVLALPPGAEFKASANLIAGGIIVDDRQRSGLLESLLYTSTGYESSDRKLMVVASHVFGDIRIFREA